MDLDNHRATLRAAQAAVQKVRGLRQQMQRDAATIAGEKFTPAYQAEHKAKIREAAKAQAAEHLKQTGILAALATALADRDKWSREGIIRRSTRFTTAVETGDLLTADRQHTALLSDIRELLSANHWRETARELSVPELLATFEEQLPRRQFAVCAVILREADRRGAVATAEGQPDGADARALPIKMRAVLEAADMPEFAATDAVFSELAQVSSYLDDAVSALDTDDDPGARRQQIVELQKQGATNDEIRKALAATAA
jgi:uncharacterized protein YdcH (DUF465 family)